MKVKDLYKVDMLSYDSKIGYITNLGTTFYEMQSQYPKGSREYEELEKRLKLCCMQQSAQIDHSKGIEIEPIPKHWTTRQIIYDTDSEEEIERKEFENKLVVDKRPYFMRYLYKHYNKEYTDFRNDFDRFSLSLRGKVIDELTEDDKKDPQVAEMLKYYNKKNPLLETKGTMNRLCNYMVGQTKPIGKKSSYLSAEETFELLFNYSINIDNEKLDKLKAKKKEYDDFKKTRQLENSQFADYQQYFKFLRNKCFEEISSDLKELANLAVYICYKENPNKDKNFCWDLFGAGIVENLKASRANVHIPVEIEDGDTYYLGRNYKMFEFNLEEMEKKEENGEDWWQETLELFDLSDMDMEE